MNKIYILILVTTSFFLNGCRSNETKNKYIGSNKVELEKAIYYFKKEGNKEKLEATYYLIDNLDINNFPSGRIFDQYEPLFDLLDSLNHKGIDIRKKDRRSSMKLFLLDLMP